MPTPAESPPLLNQVRRLPSCPDLAGSGHLQSVQAHIQATTPPAQSPSSASSPGTDDGTPTPTKASAVAIDDVAPASSSSRSTTVEPDAPTENPYYYPPSDDLGFAITPQSALVFSDEYSIRKRNSHLSSLFRPGSRFVGTQTDKHTYSVQVTIQQMDMNQSTLCGYLQIDGLTSTLPSMTTYFDGEIVGPHFGFITEHTDWGATAKTDLAHWGRFPAFKTLAKLVAADPDYRPQNVTQREYVFMRWKERFLVPDHRMTEVRGASYAGFYYICFHQTTGNLTGVYFHEEHDRYQSLSLRHVHDRGVMAEIRWN